MPGSAITAPAGAPLTKIGTVSALYPLTYLAPNYPSAVGAVELIAPGTNTGGLVVVAWECNYDGSGGRGSLLAKASAPTGHTDGRLIATGWDDSAARVSPVCAPPVRVPPGLGVYFYGDMDQANVVVWGWML